LKEPTLPLIDDLYCNSGLYLYVLWSFLLLCCFRLGVRCVLVFFLRTSDVALGS
jgi:hypothetical protein